MHDPAAIRRSFSNGLVYGQRIDRFAVAGRSEGTYIKSEAGACPVQTSGAIGGCRRKSELPRRTGANRRGEKPEEISAVCVHIPFSPRPGQIGQAAAIATDA